MTGSTGRDAIGRVLNDRRGVSTIELALVMPVLVLLFLGAVDLAFGFAQRMMLEQAASRTIQQAMIQGAGPNDYDYLAQAAADASGQPLSNITLTKWLECDGVQQSSFDGYCGNSQVIARRVSIAINEAYSPPFNFSAVPGLSATPGLTPATLSGTARVRTQ